MKVSEDRFPLLCVYLEDQEDEYNVRARTLTKGAAEIMGKWPQYLTFVTYMSVIGLLSLLVCLIMSVFVLSLIPHELHSPRRFSLVKCGSKERMDHAFHLTNFDGIDGQNATFILDDRDDRSPAACAIESYLTWTSLPVYHVRLTSKDSEDNETIFREFQKKFKNYRILSLRADDFLRGTTFADMENRDGSTLRFLSKILLAWNFGGIILDSDLISLSNFRNLLDSESDLVMGLIGPDNVLISAKRVCHSFMFSLMKYMTKVEGSKTPAEITQTVQKDFCGRGQNCSSIQERDLIWERRPEEGVPPDEILLIMEDGSHASANGNEGGKYALKVINKMKKKYTNKWLRVADSRLEAYLLKCNVRRCFLGNDLHNSP